MTSSRHNTLALFVVNGKLFAASILDKAIVKTWETSLEEFLPGNFGKALEEAKVRTEFRGGSAFLMLEPPQMEHTYLKVPPVGKKDLWKILSTKVRSKSIDPTDSIWSYTSLIGIKSEHAVTLHTVPSFFLTEFLEFCRSHKTRPRHILPLSDLIQSQFRKMDLKKGEYGLSVSKVQGKTFIFIGAASGHLIFERYLNYAWQDEGGGEVDRVGLEINRLILYTKQQFGISIAIIHIAGGGAEPLRQKLASKTNPPIHVNHGLDTISEWALEALPLKPGRTSNFLTKEIEVTFHQPKYLFVSALALAFFSLYTLVSSLWLEHTLLNYRKNTAHVKTLALVIRKESDSLSAEVEALRKIDGFRTHLQDRKLDPIPGWFAGFVGDCTPAELVLRDLEVTRDGKSEKWKAALEGIGPANPTASAKILSRYQSRLSGPPFHVRITEPWQLLWTANLQSGSTSPTSGRYAPFRILGEIP
jgi:hypothetical protein